MNRREAFVVVSLIALASILTACTASSGGGGNGDGGGAITYSAIPKSLWGYWLKIGGGTEYYVSDSFIQRTDSDGSIKFPFEEASEENGIVLASCGTIAMGKMGELYIVADEQVSSGTPFYIARKAPLNVISASAMYQGPSSGKGARALVAAGNVSLVIANVLHNKTERITTDSSGSFTIPDAVPGDTYKIVPVLNGAGVSFTIVSTPNMTTSEGGTVAIPETGVEGAFKIALEYQPSSVDGAIVDAYAYHYAGNSYSFRLRLANAGTQAGLTSVNVEWENAANAPPSSFPLLATAYAKDSSELSQDFRIIASAPSGGAEYVDVAGKVTMVGADGLTWTDRVAHRFYVDNLVEVGLSGRGVSATIIDPEGKTIGIAGEYDITPSTAALIPRRAEGYRIAVVNASAETSQPDAYYSIAVSDRSPASDGAARRAVPSRSLAGYAFGSKAKDSFEISSLDTYGNNSYPQSGTKAREAQTIRPGESIVSCVNHIEGAKDIDWFVVKCDRPEGADSLEETASFPLAAAQGSPGPGIGDLSLFVDGAGNPHFFFYSWSSAANASGDVVCSGLKLEHLQRISGAWTRDTVADLSSVAPLASAVKSLSRGIEAREASGAWTVGFCSWSGADAIDAIAQPRLASGRPGSWTVGPAPANTMPAMAISKQSPLFRFDGTGGAHLAYEGTTVSGTNSSVYYYYHYYYSKASGLEWGEPFDIRSKSTAGAIYGLDLSTAFPKVYGLDGDYVRAWQLAAGGLAFSIAGMDFPGDLARQMPDPSGPARVIFMGKPDGGALFHDFVTVGNDCYVRAFSEESGAGFSSFWIGTRFEAGFTAPAERGSLRAAATQDRELIVMDLDRSRFAHHPPLPDLPAAAGAGASAGISLALTPAGKAIALLRWDASSGGTWGYAMYEEP